ncbi:hypothetical protein ACLOJK_018262 [Asimina triloba]
MVVPKILIIDILVEPIATEGRPDISYQGIIAKKIIPKMGYDLENLVKLKNGKRIKEKGLDEGTKGWYSHFMEVSKELREAKEERLELLCRVQSLKNEVVENGKRLGLRHYLLGKDGGRPKSLPLRTLKKIPNLPSICRCPALLPPATADDHSPTLLLACLPPVL